MGARQCGYGGAWSANALSAGSLLIVAGSFADRHSRARGNPFVRAERAGAREQKWIPAFAGMTVRTVAFAGMTVRTVAFAGMTVRTVAFAGVTVPAVTFAGMTTRCWGSRTDAITAPRARQATARIVVKY